MIYLLLLSYLVIASLSFVMLCLWIAKGVWKARARHAEHQLAIQIKRCEDIEVDNVRMFNREMARAAPSVEWPEILER